MPRVAVAWSLLVLCTAGTSAQNATAWTPSRNVEVIVQSAAGGSSDRSARVVQAPEWKKDVAQNAWAEDFMGSAKTLAHLETENAMLSKMLLELGVVNR